MTKLNYKWLSLMPKMLNTLNEEVKEIWRLDTADKEETLYSALIELDELYSSLSKVQDTINNIQDNINKIQFSLAVSLRTLGNKSNLINKFIDDYSQEEPTYKGITRGQLECICAHHECEDCPLNKGLCDEISNFFETIKKR